MRKQSDPPLDKRLLEAACDTAVETIRAVPELRWGAVDLVMPKAPPDVSSPRPRWNVEGLSLDRKVSQDDVVVAGDISNLFEFITGS